MKERKVVTGAISCDNWDFELETSLQGELVLITLKATGRARSSGRGAVNEEHISAYLLEEKDLLIPSASEAFCLDQDETLTYEISVKVKKDVCTYVLLQNFLWEMKWLAGRFLSAFTV